MCQLKTRSLSLANGRMKFDDLDKKMRVFETAYDFTVLPDIYIVARIDGRSFTRLTKEVCSFEAPFDESFRDMMVNTLKHLMTCGFNITYGYTESDEISLLFALDESMFKRKIRKLISILAGEASGKFSVELGHPVAFDARLSQLPTVDLVVDYFRWRNEDAVRNALNGHCYWLLRSEGYTAKQATQKLKGRSVAEKNDLLYGRGINFNEVPNWQKRGIGVYWEPIEVEGYNPQTGERTTTVRRHLKVDYDLPMQQQYSGFVKRFVPTK